MPAPDSIHDAVKNALVKAGWLITHDPYVVQFEEITLFADLGAERAMAAQLGSHKIVVEVKSFVSRSPIQDLKLALGQYDLVSGLLGTRRPRTKAVFGC
ncbi:element excision factor XisH family protein [Candidatus Amarolinea aalborgensis]|uniref:element excision factor XisH family protein n=1 Tax=Candidatus Amarolinea aalborgensis TaxID=2249329 RepID=UPI003BF9C00B